MNLFLRYREQVYKLSYALGQELEQLLLTFTTKWRVEHADDGTHGAVTATSVVVEGTSDSLVDVRLLSGTTGQIGMRCFADTAAPFSLQCEQRDDITTAGQYPLDIYHSLDAGLSMMAGMGVGFMFAMERVSGGGRVTMTRDRAITRDANAEDVAREFVIRSGGVLTLVLGIDPDSGQRLNLYSGAIQLAEMTEPDAPAANGARLYVKDNGSGKTQLCVRFATGAVQVIATEP
jgi:hypothetical protein